LEGEGGKGKRGAWKEKYDELFEIILYFHT
jgi:hypothetical protein